MKGFSAQFTLIISSRMKIKRNKAKPQKTRPTRFHYRKNNA